MCDADIEKLAIDLANAKDVEANARNARIDIENKLATAIGGKDNGLTTIRAGRFSIAIKRGYNYKINSPEAFASKFPDFVRHKESIELVPSKYEVQRNENSSLYWEMAEYITATPKKVSIELRL